MVSEATVARRAVFVVIIVLIVSVIAVALIYQRQLYQPDLSKYGSYEIISFGECQAKACGVPGTKLVTERCVRNSITGFGCFDPELGDQSFSLRSRRESCTRDCVFSDWFLQSATECSQNGIRDATYICREVDGRGPNLCTESDGTLREVGETMTVEESCEPGEQPVPQPAEWLVIQPLNNSNPSVLGTRQPDNCTFVDALTPSPSCRAIGGNGVFSLLEEGTEAAAMSCLVSGEPPLVYSDLGSPVTQCPVGECESTPINGNNIINESIPENWMAYTCPFVSPSSSPNPTCVRLCRLVSSSLSTGTEYDALLGSLVVLRQGDRVLILEGNSLRLSSSITGEQERAILLFGPRVIGVSSASFVIMLMQCNGLFWMTSTEEVVPALEEYEDGGTSSLDAERLSVQVTAVLPPLRPGQRAGEVSIQGLPSPLVFETLSFDDDNLPLIRRPQAPC